MVVENESLCKSIRFISDLNNEGFNHFLFIESLTYKRDLLLNVGKYFQGPAICFDC